MPLARYFLLVGGALLAVLLAAGALLPSQPLIERVEAQRTIRIHSGMKLPERIVFDTSQPALTPPVAPVTAEPAAPPPLSADDVSAKARQAFAQMQSSETSKSNVAESKRPEISRSPPRRSETRRRAAAPRKIRLARQPQFDWFGGRMWW
jgi:hypothetical protein